jgi:hypothetical protein
MGALRMISTVLSGSIITTILRRRYVTSQLPVVEFFFHSVLFIFGLFTIVHNTSSFCIECFVPPVDIDSIISAIDNERMFLMSYSLYMIYHIHQFMRVFELLYSGSYMFLIHHMIAGPLCILTLFYPDTQRIGTIITVLHGSADVLYYGYRMQKSGSCLYIMLRYCWIVYFFFSRIIIYGWVTTVICIYAPKGYAVHRILVFAVYLFQVYVLQRIMQIYRQYGGKSKVE